MLKTKVKADKKKVKNKKEKCLEKEESSISEKDEPEETLCEKNFIEFGAICITESCLRDENDLHITHDTNETKTCLIQNLTEQQLCASEDPNLCNTNEHISHLSLCDDVLPTEPSAPLLMEDSFNELQFFDTHEIQNNSKVENLNINVYKDEGLADSVSEIKPFTEIQLATLYDNCLLDDKEKIIADFIGNEKNVLNCEFYEIVQNYLDARISLIRVEEELQSCDVTLKKLHKCIWNFEEITENEDDVCLDNVVVKAHFKYEMSHFQEQIAKKLHNYSKKIRTIIFESHTLYVYQAEVQKLRVENYIQNIISMCSKSQDLSKYSPVTCYSNNNISNENIPGLKECVSVLFSFCRRGIEDELFNRDIKSMLSDAVALLLRLACYVDNFFILNHLLRCPAGVGDWGSHFIQIPSPPTISDQFMLGCAELDYALTILSIILSPINQRDSFLSCYREDKKKTCIWESDWVVIDPNSDQPSLNEDDGKQLHENDIIQFINQIPFEGIFKHVLSIEDDYSVDQSAYKASPHSIMKLLAFSTRLLNIFEHGLLNYSKPEYNGVSKRICRLFSHTVMFVTQHWSEYQSIHNPHQVTDIEEDAMLQRLQIEYDEFMERLVRTIFNLRQISGVWESLCAVPYSKVSSYKMCKVLCNLFTGYTEDIPNEDYRELISNYDIAERFFDFVTQLDDCAVFFFLTALSNMAIMRSSMDKDIIEIITINIFKASFVNNNGKESVNRAGREVLSSINNSHPFIISSFIGILEESLPTIGIPALYFFKHLDLKAWTATETDLNSLSKWILLPPNSIQNQLARIILEKMNWGFADDGELFLNKSTHMKVMLFLVEAHSQVYSSQHVGSNLITSGVKQVTSVVYSSSQEQLFLKWCWVMAGNFRLHHMDQSPPNVQQLILHQFNFLKNIPDPMSSIELSIIKIGLNADDPYSIFAAHLVSSWGHSIPEFCLNGPKSLEIIITSGHYEAAITILFLISPLFFQQHDELTSNVTFIKAIQSILSVDKKYSKIARRLVSNNGPEEAWELFSSFIVNQITEYKKYNLISPKVIVAFWVNVLISLPNWLNESSILNILNVICELSINDQLCWFKLKSIFIDELKLKMTPHQSTLSSIYNWVTFSSSESSNLLTKNSNSNQSWFALLILHCEAKIQNDVWERLLTFLEANPGQSLGLAVKEVCSQLDIQDINPNLLSVYRFGQQLIDLPLENQAFMATLQGFLTLHMARVFPDSSNCDSVSVIDKFYEGYINANFLKKIQQKGKDYLIFWTSNNDENEKEMFSKCTKIVEAMVIWLTDPKYYDAGFYLPSLSPKELPKRLNVILKGNWSIWPELLNCNYLERSKDTWLTTWECHRLLKENTSPTGSPSIEPMKRKIITNLGGISIIKKLKEYDEPKNPPALFTSTATLQLNISLDPDNLLFDIDRVIDMFIERSNNFTLLSKELCALDCVFLELLPYLWSNKIMKTVVEVKCIPSRMSKLKACTGAANIIIEYNGKCLNEEIKAKLTCNREKRTSIVGQSVRTPTMAMSLAALKLEKIIQKVIIRNKCEDRIDAQSGDGLKKLGRKLFYYILGKISDETNFYPPAKQLLLDSVTNLGQEFICGHSDCQEELVGKILNSDLICNSLLSSHFTPMITSIGSFEQLYEMASSHAASQPDVTFMLLSKFEVESVLRKELISIAGRRKLIQIIMNTLTSLLSSDDGSTLICSELYRVHLNMILSYNFFDHCSEILIALLDMSFNIANDNGRIVSNLWIDYINTLARGIVVFSSDMNMIEIFESIKSYVEEQTLLNELMIKCLLQCLSEHFGARRVQFGLHGLYPKYKTYVKPIAILLGIVSCSHSHLLMNVNNEISHVWNFVENLFSPWMCPMDRDMKSSCPKWVQELGHDKQLLLPWTPSHIEEPEYVSAMFAGVVQFMYQDFCSSSILSTFLDFYCRNFANQHIKEHILTVVHSSFQHVDWHHLSPSLHDLESIYRIMNEYLPECHSFIGNIFVKINWSKAEEHFSLQDTCKLSRFNVLFLNNLIRVAMEQSVRQKSNNLREVIMTAERFHWEFLDLANFENVINWVVISCDPRIVLNSEARNPIDIAIINILHMAAAFSANTTLEHPESHQKRCLLVRALIRLLITCSKKHNILLVSRLSTFEQTFAILFNHLESTIIQAIPNDRQFTEAIDLVGEALTAIEGGASPSTLQEVCRNSLLNWLRGHHSSDIFLLPLLVAISRSVLQLQHRCALLEESIKAVFKYEDSKDSAKLSLSDIISDMSFPASNPLAMFHYAAQENDLLVIYTYCRWKIIIKGDADETLLLCSLMEIFPKLNPDENSERGFILIISQILDLFRSLIGRTGSHKLGLWRHAEILASLLDNFGVDSSSGGILGVLGFGRESRLPVITRIICRSLSAFLTCQLVQPGCFRSLNEPTLEDDSIPLQDITAASLVYLNAMKKNSLYSEYKSAIDWVLTFMQEYCHSVLDGNILLAGLVKLLFYNDVTLNHLTFNLLSNRNDPVIDKLFKITQGVVKSVE